MMPSMTIVTSGRCTNGSMQQDDVMVVIVRREPERKAERIEEKKN
jgi:hypothetical protein